MRDSEDVMSKVNYSSRIVKLLIHIHTYRVRTIGLLISQVDATKKHGIQSSIRIEFKDRPASNQPRASIE